MTEEGLNIKMDRDLRWEFDHGGVYFHYLYSLSSHLDSLLQPLILALDSTYAKVVEPILDCTFSLFSLKLIHAEIDHPRPSRNNTSSVYTMIDGVCRLAGLEEEAIELGVLHGLLSAIRSTKVLIRDDYLVHAVKTCYNMYLSGLSGTNRAVSKIAFALIAGNSILLKPPTQSAIATLYMLGVNCISFTSGDTGIAISKTAGMVFLQMELSGKDAYIGLEDADLHLVATNVIKGGFSYCGQRCIVVKVILVMESVTDTLVEKVKARVANLIVGPPEDITLEL